MGHILKYFGDASLDSCLKNILVWLSGTHEVCFEIF